MHHIRHPWILLVSILLLPHTAVLSQEEPATPAAEQSDTTPEEQADVVAEAPSAETGKQLSTWNRLIYVPFRELRNVFNTDDANAVIPYSRYMELLKHYLQQKQIADESPEAVINRAVYQATVEQDVARITVEFTITVLKESGWARIPLSFGQTAVGKVSSTDDANTLLQGSGNGQYELLLKNAGDRTVTLELLAAVTTSPEARLFSLDVPPVAINQLSVTIPQADQTVTVGPIQVLLPAEGNSDSQTVVNAALGAARNINVRWYPKAGLKPQMDLLTSVTNVMQLQVEPQLVQVKNTFAWEILRGELQEATILVPLNSRIIDITARTGRIQTWTTTATESHQIVRVQLIQPVSDQLQFEVQTEQETQGETLQLLGRSADGKLRGVHAEGVVRESGRITINTDASLTLIPKTQSGVKRVSAQTSDATAAPTWEFSGSRGLLTAQIKPVEPRLIASQNSRYVFGESDLQVITHLDYAVDRAGVFELRLKYPESLTIDSVRADGMSEFNVDKSDGTITLALTNRRMGNIGVDIRGHQAFDPNQDGAETVIPVIETLGTERSTGQITILAPRFLDVVTVEERSNGLTPARSESGANVGRAAAVSAWNFTQQPWSLAVQTSPRPSQVDAFVGTTADIDPEIVRFKTDLRINIRNAGIDTIRISVPQNIADDIRFRSMDSQHTIQQREKAPTAEDGWVTWTLTLQNEITGTVRLAAEWERTLPETSDESERSFDVQPLRVLPPFPDGTDLQRRVTLTQVQGEFRLLRHESLSVTATGTSEATETIDVRELRYLPKEGFLAFRYFAQPASANVSIRQHEIHEVVATVISKAAFEVVTEKQRLASYRCRFRVTSSERQRLRVDVPAESQLQAPSIDGRRTTFEPAADVDPSEGWQAYYINISRTGNSDQSFLLAFHLRCPITADEQYPWQGQGGEQILRLPQMETTGNTVVQETRVGIWTPKDISVFGEPDDWTPMGQPTWSLWRPLESFTTRNAVSLLNDWVGDNSGAGNFTHQGNATVFRTLGTAATVQAKWWNRPFLVAVVSGALLLIGLILRRTSWENRITLILLGIVAIAVWHLNDQNAATQIVSAGSIGMLAVAAIWTTGLLPGRRDKSLSGPPDPSTVGDDNESSTTPTPDGDSETDEDTDTDETEGGNE